MFFEKLVRHRHKIIAVVCGQVLAALGTLIGVRLLTEYISPAVFGQYKLLLAAISLATGIFIRPVIQFMMREYHDYLRDGLQDCFVEVARRYFRIYMVVVALAIGLLMFVIYRGELGETFFVVIVAMVVLLLHASIEYERALFTTGNRQVGAAVINIITKWSVPAAIVAVTLMYHETVLVMMVATMIVSFCILVGLIFTENNKRKTRAERVASKTINGTKLVREAMRYARPLMLVGVFSWIVNEGDRYFLNYYQSHQAVGIYAAAYGLVSAPFTLVVGTLAQFLYPIVFQSCSTNDPLRHRQVVADMLKVTVTVCVLGVVFVAFFSNAIASVGLGEQYRAEAVKIMVWVAAGYGFLAVAMTFDMAAYGLKRTFVMLYSYAVAAIINISLDIILIPEFSVLGAAIATTLAFAGYLIVMLLFYFYSDAKRNFAGNLL